MEEHQGLYEHELQYLANILLIGRSSLQEITNAITNAITNDPTNSISFKLHNVHNYEPLRDLGEENWTVFQKIGIPEGFYSGQPAWALVDVNSSQYTVVTSESFPEGCVPKIGDVVNWSKTTENILGFSSTFEDLFGRKWSVDTCGLTTNEGNLTRLFLGPEDIDIISGILSD